MTAAIAVAQLWAPANQASTLPVPAAATAGKANGRTQQTPQATAPAAVVRAATDAVRSGPVAPRTIRLEFGISVSVVWSYVAALLLVAATPAGTTDAISAAGTRELVTI